MMRLSEFARQIADFEPKKGAVNVNTLEIYLRAFWGVIQEHDGSKPSAEQVVQWFQRAWMAPSVPFNEVWINLLENEDMNNRTKMRDDFDYFKAILCYQIADLHQLFATEANKGDYLYLTGVKSPAGNTWYNLDIISFLEAAISGIKDVARQDVDLDTLSWADLITLLQMGRMYE